MTPGRKDMAQRVRLRKRDIYATCRLQMDLDDILDEAAGDASTAQIDPSNEDKAGTKRGDTVSVDDDHPFDLESYISNYTGTIKVYLSFIDFNDS